MASEGTSSSPPAVTGSSFSIENLLNLSESATEKPSANIPSRGTSCDSLSRPSFPLVPRAVRPFVCHGHNLPFCTPESAFKFGETPYFRSEGCVHHFPIPNNRPPLGVELFAIKRRRPMRKKKQRPLFSTHQIQTMEKEFTKCRYVTESRRAELASDLNLTETQVKTWFQNRRTKSKKEIRDQQEKLTSEIRRRSFEFTDQYLLGGERNIRKQEPHTHSFFSYNINPSFSRPLLGHSSGLM